MTNQEKYGLTNEQVKRLSCEIDDFVMEQCAGNLSHLIEMFFREQVKPTLTEDEKVILNRIRNFYTHIKRTNAGLKITSGTLGAELGLPFNMFDDNLFQFIQPGEEYSIKELLDDE